MKTGTKRYVSSDRGPLLLSGRWLLTRQLGKRGGSPRRVFLYGYLSIGSGRAITSASSGSIRLRKLETVHESGVRKIRNPERRNGDEQQSDGHFWTMEPGSGAGAGAGVRGAAAG
jgi:hypothetical protein